MKIGRSGRVLLVGGVGGRCCNALNRFLGQAPSASLRSHRAPGRIGRAMAELAIPGTECSQAGRLVGGSDREFGRDAFLERPNGPTFGAPTAGHHSNASFPMSDGALLLMTGVHARDRAGRDQNLTKCDRERRCTADLGCAPYPSQSLNCGRPKKLRSSRRQR